MERVARRGDVTDLRERDGRGTVGCGCWLAPRAISSRPPRNVSLYRRVQRFLQRAATGEISCEDRGQAALDGRARHRLWLSAGHLHPWPLRDPVRSLSDQASSAGRRPRLLACRKWPQAPTETSWRLPQPRLDDGAYSSNSVR